MHGSRPLAGLIPDSNFQLLTSPQKESSLLFLMGISTRSITFHHVLPDLAFDGLRGVAQQVGGVKGRHQRRAFKVQPFAARGGDFAQRVGAEEAAEGGVAEGDNDFWFHNGELRAQKWQGKGDLQRCWFAIAPLGRHFGPPFHDVADVNFFARQTHGLNDSGEQTDQPAPQTARLAAPRPHPGLRRRKRFPPPANPRRRPPCNPASHERCTPGQPAPARAATPFAGLGSGGNGMDSGAGIGAIGWPSQRRPVLAAALVARTGKRAGSAAGRE